MLYHRDSTASSLEYYRFNKRTQSNVSLRSSFRQDDLVTADADVTGVARDGCMGTLEPRPRAEAGNKRQFRSTDIRLSGARPY